MNIAKLLISAFLGLRQRPRYALPRSAYTGDELREIRKRNGVGRPPRIGHTAPCRDFRRGLHD